MERVSKYFKKHGSQSSLIKYMVAVIFSISTISVSSQSIDKEKAVEVARKFYTQTLTGGAQLKSAENISFTISETVSIETTNNLKSAKTSTAFYVINYGNNDGFIIVGGDRRLQPVLGYSENGNYQGEELPAHIASFFKQYQDEISDIVVNGDSMGLQPNARWDELENGGLKSGSTSSKFNLVSSKWGQGKFYNDSCPEDDRMASPKYNGHVPAGCVAAVMSQIIHYWSWPESGNGSTCYTHDEYGEQCADFELAQYNFQAMPQEVSGKNEAVANLFYHSAVAVKMNFTTAGSSAYSSTAVKAFKNNFRFSGKAEFVYRNDYSGQEWVGLLKNHLDNGVPLYYRGDMNGRWAHAFICDGYDTEGRFHFNWGWDGKYDGFFALSAISPKSNYNYNSNQGAIINLIPLNNDFAVTGLSVKQPSLATNESLAFTYNQVYSGSDFQGINVDFEYWLSEEESGNSSDLLLGNDQATLSSGENIIEFSKSLALPENLNPGQYYLMVNVKQEGNDNDINSANNIQTIAITVEEAGTGGQSQANHICSDELEPNNSQYETVSLGCETNYYNNNLCLSSGDEDWFEFELNSETYFACVTLKEKAPEGYYGIEFNFSNNGANINTFEVNGACYTKIRLYNNEMQMVSENNHGGESSFAQLFYSPSYSVTGVNNQPLANTRIYPNPAQGKVYINTGLGDGKGLTVKLHDIRGTLLETKTFGEGYFCSEYPLDLSKYSNGQYIIRIQTIDGGCATRKIIKNS